MNIGNYLKCKWIKCSNEKTGWIDTKTRPICLNNCAEKTGQLHVKKNELVII